MALVDIQPNARERAGRGTKKVASLEPHGGGRVATPAARGLAAALANALRGSVWAPLLLKALGVLFGMLALAAIGASSIARGSGIPAPARTAAQIAAAGVTPLAAPADAGAPADGSAADAGTAPKPEAGGTDALTADGKVILNLAGVNELRRIPGVGPKRAEAIVALRAKLGGRFKRLSDLLRVKGIGVRSLKKMEAYLVLDAPKAPPAPAASN